MAGLGSDQIRSQTGTNEFSHRALATEPLRINRDLAINFTNYQKATRNQTHHA